MRIINLITITITTVLLTGCFCETPDPVIKTVYITKIKEVKVPVGCKVPKIDCSFKGEGFKPTLKLLNCVAKQKKVLNTIRLKQNNLNLDIVE